MHGGYLEELIKLLGDPDQMEEVMLNTVSGLISRLPVVLSIALCLMIPMTI